MMDEKTAVNDRHRWRSPLPLYQTNQEQMSRRRSHRPFLVIVAFACFFLILRYASLVHLPTICPSKNERMQRQSGLLTVNQSSLVPLEAHIMSKCPDAKTCLEKLVVPAMEQIVDIVDFRLSYIGRIDENDTIHCMHGSTECLGNMLSLCADDLFPNKPKISLGFSTCLIRSYQRIPSRDLVESCALEHGISFEKLNACISEEGKGLDLLEASVMRSEKAGVEKSCTVRVGGEQWCIMDNGKWKNCEGGHDVDDLVTEVKRRHRAA